MQNYGMNSHNSAALPVKILVVDDYPNAAALLARSLSRLDTSLEVVPATSAHEALQYIQNGSAHIVITDMDMPDMTGLELIERLQEDSIGTPIVPFLITAAHTQELKIKARELNVREIFYKPIHPERIGEVISRTLEEMHKELL
jgi:CheY-like chemotaxis protein